MNAERWKQIDELFAAVLEIPEPERERFLSEKCDGDDNLKNEVLSLLKVQPRADNFLETVAMRVAANRLAAETNVVPGVYFSGKTIGVYKIEKPIGAGGMGEVYLAWDEKLRRKVALKILPAEYTASDERVKRFELEAKAISILNHPNIVTIFDVGTTDAEGINYIATEYVEGQTLREFVGKNLKTKDVLNIITQACEALATAHSAGIIHRDIKPENIMVRPDGYVKVLDFGLAKLGGDIETKPTDNFARTAKGVVIGTPAYMSPEQVTGDDVDHRTDLWSVGVVLYELLTGFNPYKKETRQATFQSILLDELPLASTFNAEVSGELDRILNKALEKDSDISYQTAADLRADLKRVRRAIDSASGQKVFLTQRRGGAKAQRLFLLFAFCLLPLMALAAWYFGFRQSEPEAVDWSQANKIQLTDRAGTEIFPTLAPDGKSFVFAARTERGDYDLFVQRVGDKRARSITEDSPDDDTQPAFSPDGERIAFHSKRGGADGVYVASASGENARRIADFGSHPAWSPDGKELVFSALGNELPDTRTTKPSEIWIVTLETGAQRQIEGAMGMQPAWSPDGKYVAYWFFPPSVGRRDVGIVNVNGGAPVVITGDGTTNWNPVWSPDGKFLYFASDRGGDMSFWRVPFADGKPAGEAEAVSTPAKYSRHLAFSRDGKRLIFVSTDNRANLQAVNFDPQTEKIVGEPFWVTQGDREISRPELSPDGTRFVFRLSRRTQDDIVTVNRDGTNQTDLTNDAAFDRYPRWSPDGTRIAFASDRSGVYEIWTINADGTNLRQITFTNKEGTSFPIWSPDGRRILYRSTPHTYIVDADKKWTEQTPEMLPPFDPTDRRRFLVWNWSPDGALLTGNFSGTPMETGFYSFAENRFEIVAKMENFPMWLPDSRRIIYGFENKIHIADTITKKTRELDVRPTEKIQTIGISRDGRLVYYTLSSSESDIWLLDNSPAR